MKKAIALAMSVVALCTICLTGCLEDVQQNDTRTMEQQQKVLQKTQPVPMIDYSLAREELIKRLMRFNDPNKISYIYLLADNGVVMAFYPLKGRPQSLNTYLTPLSWPYNSSYSLDAPDQDGSYGWNNEGIFFFTSDDVYVEWNGQYMLADQPLKLTTQPIFIYQASPDK